MKLIMILVHFYYYVNEIKKNLKKKLFFKLLRSVLLTIMIQKDHTHIPLTNVTGNRMR